MIIYNNGCSHTYEAYTKFSNSYIDIVASELTDFKFKSIYPSRGFFKKDRNNSIADNHIIYKNAYNGKSNDLIFFETLNFIYTKLFQNQKIDLLVIQWSGPNRRFHSLPNGKIANINLYDNYELGVKFEPLATEQTLHYMKVLQDLCQMYDINYVFIPYMEMDETVANNHPILKLLNKDKFTGSIIEGHRRDFLKKNLTRDVGGHPNMYGVYKLAELILGVLGLSLTREIKHYFKNFY
jgi:hypothetical protein